MQHQQAKHNAEDAMENQRNYEVDYAADSDHEQYNEDDLSGQTSFQEESGVPNDESSFFADKRHSSEVIEHPVPTRNHYETTQTQSRHQQIESLNSPSPPHASAADLRSAFRGDVDPNDPHIEAVFPEFSQCGW